MIFRTLATRFSCSKAAHSVSIESARHARPTSVAQDNLENVLEQSSQHVASTEPSRGRRCRWRHRMSPVHPINLSFQGSTLFELPPICASILTSWATSRFVKLKHKESAHDKPKHSFSTCPTRPNGNVIQPLRGRVCTTAVPCPRNTHLTILSALLVFE